MKRNKFIGYQIDLSEVRRTGTQETLTPLKTFRLEEPITREEVEGYFSELIDSYKMQNFPYEYTLYQALKVELGEDEKIPSIIRVPKLTKQFINDDIMDRALSKKQDEQELKAWARDHKPSFKGLVEIKRS
jgi:hypothetical protein